MLDSCASSCKGKVKGLYPPVVLLVNIDDAVCSLLCLRNVFSVFQSDGSGDVEGAEGPAPPGQPAGAAEPVPRGTGTPRALLHRQDLPPHRLQAQPETEVPYGLPVPLGAVRHRQGRQGRRDVRWGRRQTLRPVRPGRGARIRHVNHALQVRSV